MNNNTLLEKDMKSESSSNEQDSVTMLDLETYRKFLSRISGVSPDTDNEIADRGCENTLDSVKVFPNGIVSYQCYKKATNSENLDMALGGFTPDDIFEPVNVVVNAMIDATSPDFTKFSFVFDIDTEDGNESYSMMKKALLAFDSARMNVTDYNVNEYIPFFFCEILSSDNSEEKFIKCNYCNPLLISIREDKIEVIVPTSLVSFVVD